MSSYYWRHMDRELNAPLPDHVIICTDPLWPLRTSAIVSSVALQELALNFQSFIYSNKFQNFRHLSEKLRNIC